MDVGVVSENSQEKITLEQAKAAVIAWAENNGGPAKAKDNLAKHFGIKMSEMDESQAEAVFIHFSDPANGGEIDPVETVSIDAAEVDVPRDIAEAPIWAIHGRGQWDGCYTEGEMYFGFDQCRRRPWLGAGEVLSEVENELSCNGGEVVDVDVCDEGRRRPVMFDTKPTFFAVDGWRLLVLRNAVVYGRGITKPAHDLLTRMTGAAYVDGSDLYVVCRLDGELSSSKSEEIDCLGVSGRIVLAGNRSFDTSRLIWATEDCGDCSEVVEELIEETYQEQERREEKKAAALRFAAEQQRAKETDGAVSLLRLRSTASPRATTVARRPLVEGFLWPAKVGVIGGLAKTFKSNIAIELAVAVAHGGRFLDYAPEPEETGPVILFSAEFDDDGDLFTRIDSVRDARGVADTGHLFASAELPDLFDPDRMASLSAAVIGKGAKLVIVDPCYQETRGVRDEANDGALLYYLMPLRQLAKESGAAVMLVNHFTRSKRHANQEPSLGDIKGSAYEKFARQWILVSKTKDLRNGKATLQLVAGSAGSQSHCGRYTLEIDQGGSQPTQWVTRLTDKSAQPAASAAKAGRPNAALRSVLAALDDTQLRTVTSIREVAGLNGLRARTAIEEGISDGLIEAGTMDTGHTGYRLSQGVEGPVTLPIEA